jgi:hypothetical protein
MAPSFWFRLVRVSDSTEEVVASPGPARPSVAKRSEPHAMAPAGREVATNLKCFDMYTYQLRAENHFLVFLVGGANADMDLQV